MVVKPCLSLSAYLLYYTWLWNIYQEITLTPVHLMNKLSIDILFTQIGT